MATLKEQDVVLLDYDAEGNPIIQMPITRTENVEGLTDALAEKQAAGSYANETHTHAIADVTGLQTVLDGKQAAGSYATATDLNAKINLSGSRGTLAGYNTPASTSAAVTISASSNDDTVVTAAVAVTVSNGSSGQSWTKTVALQNASATVTLGSSWKWMNNEVPTIVAKSILVLKWTGSFGIANMVYGS